MWENHYISNGKDFDKLLTSISPLWRNYKAVKSPSPKIVLFACGTNKVAERISQTESFNGIDIIAPNDNVLAWPQNGYLPIVGHQVKISTD
uniref:hypothetical protein n=1 Tax=Prevotella dentasini TaxID=589537 RepID=UPI0011DD8A11